MHLVDYVETTAAELWNSMKEKLSGELQGILTKLGWPSTTLDVTQDPAFETAFVKLLDLQEPYVSTSVRSGSVCTDTMIGSFGRMWMVRRRTKAVHHSYHWE